MPEVTADTRTHAEAFCDMVLVGADGYYRDLLAGLNDFVSGDTTRQLIKLQKAAVKLRHLDNSPIGEATKLLPTLIMKVKEDGETLKRSLSRDVLVVLEVINDVVRDFDNYVLNRDGPTDDIRFQDLLLSRNTDSMGVSEGVTTTLVSMEGVDITRFTMHLFKLRGHLVL